MFKTHQSRPPLNTKMSLCLMLNNQHDLIILTEKGAWWFSMSQQSRRVLLLLLTTNAQPSADSACFGEIRLRMFNHPLINQAKYLLLTIISASVCHWKFSPGTGTISPIKSVHDNTGLWQTPQLSKWLWLLISLRNAYDCQDINY